MQTYATLAFIAMILFSINAIVFKVASGIDAITLTLVSFSTSAVGTFIYWWFFVSDKRVSTQVVAWGLVAGIISVGALALYIKAIKLGRGSVVNAIRALSVGVTLILAVLILREKVSLVNGLGIILAAIAATLLSV